MTTKRGSILWMLLLLLVCTAMIWPEHAEAQQLAFPGAEGGGRFAVGGRGGTVYEVTNLNDSGAGSLRDAVSQPNRTVVFKVSGIIRLNSTLQISKNNVTIAGQTAPGDGICITGYTVNIKASDIIIRHIRCRLSDVKDIEDDAMHSFSGAFQNIIVDHCSLSWSVDETGTFYDIKNFTLQWCIISESLYHSVHEKGDHGYGGIWGGNHASFHHNLLAHHTSRNPRFCGSRFTGKPEEEIVDFRNNVIYNWGNGNSSYGGEGGHYNMVNNYYKAGPATPGNLTTSSTSNKRNRILNYTSYYYATDAAVYPDTLFGGKFYIDGNYVEGYPDVTADNWTKGVQKDSYAKAAQLIAAARQSIPFDAPPVTTQTAEQAYLSVLENAGAILPKRDAIDQRIIREARTGTATYEGSEYAKVTSAGVSHPSGIIDTQLNVGGLPVYNSEAAPTDTDHDGMPDAWELLNNLNPNDASDRNQIGTDGYTNLENYLNSIVSTETGITPPDGTAVVVAQDGSGNYTTVQAAINAAPTGRTAPYIIFIRNGVYKEKISVPSNKPFIQLYGESVANTILTYDDYSGKPMPGGGTYGTSNSASVTVNGADFSAINITFENTTGDSPQALAINVNANRAAFKNCRFLGGQDTILTNGDGNKQYFRNCYIDGVVDFIFGSARAVFDSCIVYAKSRKDGLNGSYITAANTSASQPYGYVFRACTFPSNTGVTKYVLGRPWQNSTGSSPISYPKVVLLNAVIGNNQIKPEGWSVWDAGTDVNSILYAEYKSRKFNGDLVDISQRVPWSFQLGDEEAAVYSNATLFDIWDPCMLYPGFCSYASPAIAVSNFKGSKGASQTSFTWNISWPMKDILYTLYRSDGNTYEKVYETTAINDTTINFSYAEDVPPPGKTYYYYLEASKTGMQSHMTSIIQISSTPTILATGSLNDFLQGLGTPSAMQAYTLSGVNLTDDILITPPIGYEVSANGGNKWYTYASPLKLTQSNGAVALTSISVRLNANGVGEFSGNIEHTSAGSAAVYVSVRGSVQSDELPVSLTLLHWPLTAGSEDNAELRSAGVAESKPSFKNMYVSNGTTVPTVPAYSVTYGQAFSPSAAGDGFWTTASGGPGGNLNRQYYEQFTISALPNYSVRVDSIILNASYYNTSSNTKFAVVYSRSGFSKADSTNVTGGIGADGNPLLSTANGAFTTPVLLANEGGGTSNNYRFALADANGVMLAEDETLTIRLYFSCGSTSTGRYAKLKDVYIKGFAKDLVPPPVITVTGTLNAFEQLKGSISAIQTYTVSGNHLTGNINVTPPEHYEISADGAIWKNTATPLILVPTEGTILSTTISVRLNASVVGDYTGTITHVSTGAAEVDLPVNGTTSEPPVTGISGDMEQEFSISPNPSNRLVTVHHPATGYGMIINLYTITGLKAGTYETIPATASTIIDTLGMSSGIYFVECVKEKQRVMLRFIKQ